MSGDLGPRPGIVLAENPIRSKGLELRCVRQARSGRVESVLGKGTVASAKIRPNSGRPGPASTRLGWTRLLGRLPRNDDENAGKRRVVARLVVQASFSSNPFSRSI